METEMCGLRRVARLRNYRWGLGGKAASSGCTELPQNRKASFFPQSSSSRIREFRHNPGRCKPGNAWMTRSPGVGQAQSGSPRPRRGGRRGSSATPVQRKWLFISGPFQAISLTLQDPSRSRITSTCFNTMQLRHPLLYPALAIILAVPWCRATTGTEQEVLVQGNAVTEDGCAINNSTATLLADVGLTDAPCEDATHISTLLESATACPESEPSCKRQQERASLACSLAKLALQPSELTVSDAESPFYDDDVRVNW